MTLMNRPGWHDLVEEAPLDPDRPIIDSHHHLWDVPWHNYMPEEFIQDFSGHNVRATVYVECHSHYYKQGPEALRSLGETEFAVEQAQLAKTLASNQKLKCEIAAGIVSYVDLQLGDAVGDVLDAHIDAAQGRFRGVRNASAWDPHEEVRNAHSNPPKGLLYDSEFRKGFAQLVKRGLSFDAYHFQHQIHELVDLARAFPEATIISNHFGGFVGVGPYQNKLKESLALWSESITKLAACPNVYMKLGGIAMTNNGFGWHKQKFPLSSEAYTEFYMPWYEHTIEQFGPSRCMFESNFPVDRVSINYGALMNAFKRLTREFSESEKNMMFHDTANKVYQLGL